MNRLFTVLALLLLITNSFAAQLTGKVIDNGTKQAIDFANVSVLKKGETAPVTGTVTDEAGTFSLNLSDGQYTLVISFMGYSEQRRDVTVAGKPINLGRIALKEDTQMLKDVEVVGQGSSMRFELDKKVFTVDQNIASAGASVTDVLENIPSVDVDQEGNISLRNSEDVEIWINGKPAGLNSENRGQVLQQMPAGTIEKIELITNPSAKFSPEGSAGIINLVMKKDRAAGFYGSVQAGIDYSLAAPWTTPPGANAGLNINFNAGPVDGYFNVGYRYHTSNGGSKTDRYNLNGTGSQVLDSSLIMSHLQQEGLQTNRGGGMYARAGLNFRLAEGHVLGVSGFGMVSTRNKGLGMENSNHRTYLLTDPLGNVMRDFTRDQKGLGSHPGGNATLDYTFTMDNHELRVSGTYNNFGFNMDTYYEQRDLGLYNNDTTYSYQDQFSNSKDQGIEIKADYEWKPTQQSRLEAGYDYTRNWSNSFADAHNLQADGTQIAELYPYYADFKGLTQNHALYITYGNRFWDRLSIQVGLRGEYYMRHLESFYKDDAGNIQDSYAAFPNKKDTAYFQIYPSAYIGYDFGNGHELQLNYTRRVRRPWGHQINPRLDLSDSTNISYGNVDLLPAYSNNLELNYLKTWERHTLSAGVFWKYNEGAIQNIKYMDLNGETMKNTYFNVSTRQELGIEVVAKNRLFGDLLQLTTSANFYWNNIAAVHDTIVHHGSTIPINLDKQNIFAGSVRISAQFMFTKDFSGQIRANYRSPRVVAQGTTSHSYSLDIGLRHTFLNKQLALALNVRDLLDSRARRNNTWGDGFWQFSENRWHSRTISLTLTYNFGNQQGRRKGKPGEDMGGGNDDFDDSGNSNSDF